MNDWQNQDSFSEKVRDKVYDHGDTPSEGLWDKLDQRLTEEPVKKRGIAWWIPVAAVVLLGVASFGLLHDNDESAIADNQVTGETATSLPAQTEPAQPEKVSPSSNVPAPGSANAKTPGSFKEQTPRAPQQQLAQTHTQPKHSPAHKPPGRTSHKHGVKPLPVPVVIAASSGSTQNEDRQVKNSKADKPAGAGPEVTSARAATPAQTDVQQTIVANEETPHADMFPLGLLPVPQPELIPFSIPATQALPPPPSLPLPPVSVISIAIVTNVSGLSNHYAPAQNNFGNLPDNTKLAAKVSRGRINYSGGMSLGIGLTDHLMLSGGFRLGSFSEKYTYALVPHTTDPVNSGKQNPNYIADPASYYKNPGDSVIAGKGHTHINVYTFQEFPFTLTYYTPLDKTGKWNAVWEAGVSIMKISYASGAYIDVDRVGFLVFQNEQSYPGINNLYTFNASAGVSYRLSDKISFEVNPTLRRGLNSIVASKSWMQQTPTFWGCNFTMRRHF